MLKRGNSNSKKWDSTVPFARNSSQSKALEAASPLPVAILLSFPRERNASPYHNEENIGQANAHADCSTVADDFIHIAPGPRQGIPFIGNEGDRGRE
jgi:hypothetical protein